MGPSPFDLGLVGACLESCDSGLSQRRAPTAGATWRFVQCKIRSILYIPPVPLPCLLGLRGNGGMGLRLEWQERCAAPFIRGGVVFSSYPLGCSSKAHHGSCQGRIALLVLQHLDSLFPQTTLGQATLNGDQSELMEK